MSRILPPKYFEGMEERLTKLELALLKSKVALPSMQQKQSEESLFKKYIEVMELWSISTSYREEPLLNKFVSKYCRAIKECSLDNNNDFLLAVNQDALNYKDKLSLMLQSFNQLINAVNQLENSFALEDNINPPEFKSYIKPLGRLTQAINKFDGFLPDVKKFNKDVNLIMESYQAWVYAVSETISYLNEGIDCLEKIVESKEKSKLLEV